MRRREFIAGFGGVTVAGPLAARAQQSTIPVIGFIGSGTLAGNTPQVGAFRQGLKESGYVDGHNVAIEFRWAESQFDRLPSLVTDLIQRRVAIIVATGGNLSAHAAKAATTTIPIIFTTGSDPVRAGLVPSFNWPGGNVTGVTFFNDMLAPKGLELLREILPQASSIAVLMNPEGAANTASQLRDVQAAARTLGFDLTILNAVSVHEIDSAFSTLVQHKSQALLLVDNPLFNQHRQQIAALAARHAIPVCSASVEQAAAGMLVSYGNSREAVYRQAALYAGRILKGGSPADLPVIQSTIFKLVINLRNAKALGLTVPPALLARADEVIE